ncbi:MAG: DNA/RNA non-specific endonuclease [Bacilli bacterium]|nr:DNA/RNA non-specific endonuclease [Bacilli bacterium]
MIKYRKKEDKKRIILLIVLLFICLFFEYKDNIKEYFNKDKEKVEEVYELSNIPPYSGEDVIVLNNNEPEFGDLARTTESFEVYSPLDKLGRCGEAYANIGIDLMPTSKRESIGSIKPSGWKIAKYDIITDGLYLYNRCHLIAYQLTAENANPKNLITCTRHANADLMQQYEIKVGNYIRKTSNHVLYRSTPIFEGDNLVATGIQLEALSIEDNGKGIKFNVFIYNVQPGIEIDYKTGESKLIE